jgi:hypothetical protein
MRPARSVYWSLPMRRRSKAETTPRSTRKPRALPAAVAALVVTLPALLGSGEAPDETAVVAVDDLSGVVAFTPPVGDAAPLASDFDASLLSHLTVTVTMASDGADPTVVGELASPQIALKNGRYQVGWAAPERYQGQSVAILVKVAELPVGATEFTVQGRRTVPIKFEVANNPRVRTAALHADGLSATAVAQALVDEFGTTATQTALLLAEDSYAASEIAEVLRTVFGTPAETAALLLKQQADASAGEIAQALADFFGLADDAVAVAQILKNLGFGMSPIADALESGLGIDPVTVLDALEAVGFTAEDLFGLEARALAEQFAPQLRFDQSAGSFPMSAEDYFLETVQGEAGKQQNTDGSTLQSATDQPPTYYQAYLVGDQVRILFWWFYGYQGLCFGAPPGDYHHGDWERVLVTLKEDRSAVAAVTYYQHTGWYTRLANGADLNVSIGADYGRGFSSSDGHPIVYVGKTQHGSYYDQGGRGDSTTGLSYCDYFADWRNNGDATHLRMSSGLNLVSLADRGDQWMVEESLFSGTAEPLSLGNGDGVTTTFDLTSMRVDGSSLVIYLDGVEASGVTLSDGTGPGGVDQAVLTAPPASGVAVSASYRSTSFKWGPHGTDSDNNVGTHPVRSSAPEKIVGIKACEGYGVFENRGCFESQCQYLDGQNLYTELHPGVCSSCPAGYTDMGEFCGKGDWWNPFDWSTRSIHKYDLDYTLPTTDEGLCKQ